MKANLGILILALVVIGVAIVIGYTQHKKSTTSAFGKSKRKSGVKSFDMREELKELALLQAETLATM